METGILLLSLGNEELLTGTCNKSPAHGLLSQILWLSSLRWGEGSASEDPLLEAWPLKGWTKIAYRMPAPRARGKLKFTVPHVICLLLKQSLSFTNTARAGLELSVLLLYPPKVLDMQGPNWYCHKRTFFFSPYPCPQPADTKGSRCQRSAKAARTLPSLPPPSDTPQPL